MQVWLRSHDKRAWPDLSICQPDDACHVLDTEKHPDKHNIERMCSEGFFANYGYRYVHKSGAESDDETYSSCLLRESSETKRSPSGSPQYEGPYSSPVYKPRLPFKEDPLDYSCPEEKKADQGDSIKCTTLNEIKMQTASYTSEVYLYVKHAGRLDVCHNNLCQIEQEDRTIDNKPVPNSSDDSTYCGDTIHDKPTANIPEGSMCCGVYQNEGCKMGQEDCTLNNNPEASIQDDSTCGGVYQNKACNMGQEDYPIDNKPAAKTPEDNTYRFINQNKAWKMGQDDCATYDKPAANTSEGKICRCIYQSKAYKWAKKIATSTTNQQLTPQKTAHVVVPKLGKQNGPRGLYQTYSQHLRRQFIPGCLPNQGNKNGPRRLQCVRQTTR